MTKAVWNKTKSDDSQKNDLALFRALKPYIGRCLSLNHDINNPLAGIMGYTEFLLDDEDNLTKDQIGQLKQISQCAERIQKLVEELCEEKIALDKKIDLKPVVASFNNTTGGSD
ncbi:MAG: histidine kinase dimerization/phospho-acceptor domain-containing protein [candidate division Zixibacteria bacterium]|nr:histidine kinase dimerization/phospho-acceptor domain-containing protein [candidate division Zixibacteria bacterium]